MSAPEDFLVAIGIRLRPQVHSAQDHILTEGDEAKAMYWLVRGIVAVTSRDGEAVYAELKPGAFFGEIGVLMNVPRTATIVAKTKCLLLVLKKEDLHAELPRYPDMEKTIRQEAEERLSILQKKRQESGQSTKLVDNSASRLARGAAPGEVLTGEVGAIKEGAVINSKKRKSPSPGVLEDIAATGSALASGSVNVRKTLKELPLFSELPPDTLHFLGLSAQPKSYPPFTDIVRQGSPGQDIFFIVRGEAEVIHEPASLNIQRKTYARPPRLKQGQYFGEVASLGLSHERTATVRSITTVECLVIGGEALNELWKRWPEIKVQMEETARRRYSAADSDVEMADVEGRPQTGEEAISQVGQDSVPKVTFTTPSIPTSPTHDVEFATRQPSDPDPFLSVDMENIRNRRRNSLAPPPSQTDSSPIVSALKVQAGEGSPLKNSSSPSDSPPPDDSPVPPKRARTLSFRPQTAPEKVEKHSLPDDLLVAIFSHLDLLQMIRMRIVCKRWRSLLTERPDLCTHINLGQFSHKITDWSLVNIVAPFIGQRPVEMDISNCFYIQDEGFQSLWKSCAKNVKIWKMRSVYDVSASQILEMSEHAKSLEELDVSNCRKVGDNLLARVIGWVVPEPPPPRPDHNKAVIISSSASRNRRAPPHQQRSVKHGDEQSPNPAQPPPGTVIGCPKLRRLDLSYCKHITDRTMIHLANHASERLEQLSLTRCTSITDNGFQAWMRHRFVSLTHLYLADCTYLSDNSIIALVGGAKNLTHLDLSFCCALSDTATEVVALGLPLLQELKLAFCGSAVSDASLGTIALHLNDLRGLSVRGCVRVTAHGVENVLEGCRRLEWFDVSQCKNLQRWLDGGGVSRWGFEERMPSFGTSGERGSGAKSSIVSNGESKHINNQATPGTPNHKGESGVPGRRPPVIGHGSGPIMRPVVPPRGARIVRNKKLVKFIVTKGHNGLR